MILPPYRATPKHPAAGEENSSGTHNSVLPWGTKKLGTFKSHLSSKSFFFNLILKYDYVIYYRSIRVSAIGLSTAISVNELLSNFVTVLLYVLYLPLICQIILPEAIPPIPNEFHARKIHTVTDCIITEEAAFALFQHLKNPRSQSVHTNRYIFQSLIIPFAC